MTVPRLHVITDDEILARAEFIEMAAEVLEAGGVSVALHVRGPRTDGRRLFSLTDALTARAASTGALLVVNDRIDVAMAAGLRAVHLGRRSLSVGGARELLPEARVGVSCHDRKGLAEARDADASWIILGNLFETGSHSGRPGLGFERFRELLPVAGPVPVIAIGGVDRERAAGVVQQGAWGVAVRSGIWDVESPRTAACEYISELRAAGGET